MPLRRRLRKLVQPRTVLRFARKPFYRGSIPWEDLDPGIVDRVKVLHSMGLQPFASGEGGTVDLGGGFKLTMPAWVHVEDTNASSVYERLVQVGDKPHEVSRVSDRTGSYVRVVWPPR